MPFPSYRSICKAKCLLVAFFAIGITFGIAGLALPHSITMTPWFAEAVRLTLGVSGTTVGAFVAFLCVAMTIFPTPLRKSPFFSAGAKVIAKQVARTCSHAIALLLGLNCIVAYAQDWHAFTGFLSIAVWFLALRTLMLENATGMPRPTFAAASAGWLIGVTFQPTVSHILTIALGYH